MLNRTQVMVLRGVSVAMAVLFALSVTLLVWASTLAVEIAPGTLSWQGVLDVITAFALVLLGAWLTVRASPLVGRGALGLAYGTMAVVAPVMLLGMWLWADRLLWNVLLVGLAWRVWV